MGKSAFLRSDIYPAHRSRMYLCRWKHLSIRWYRWWRATKRYLLLQHPQESMVKDWPGWRKAIAEIWCSRSSFHGWFVLLWWLLAQERALLQWSVLLWSRPENMVRYTNTRRATKPQNRSHSGTIRWSHVCLRWLWWAREIQWPVALHSEELEI